MKKIFSVIIMILVLSFGLCNTSASAQFDVHAANGYDSVIIADDFESETSLFDIWYYTSQYGSPVPNIVPVPTENNAANHAAAIPTNTAAANSSGKNLDYEFMVRYTKIDSSFHPYKNPNQKTINRYCQSKLEMDVLFEDYLNSKINVIEYDCENSLGLGVRPDFPLVSFNQEGNAVFYNGKTITYEINTWYSFVFYLDYYTNTYTAYVNNQLVEKDTPLHTRFSRIGLISFGIYHEPNNIQSKLYLDNVKYSVPIYTNKRITYVRKVAGSDFEDGLPISTTFQTKGVITVEPSTVEQEKHQNVSVVYNKINESETTDSILRTHYKFVNPNFESMLLTGDYRDMAKRLVFDIDVLLYDYMSSTIHMVGHKDLNNRPLLELVRFTPSGTFRLKNNQTFDYETNKWYSFRFYIDIVNAKYSACVNGTMLAENVDFGTDGILYALSCGVQINSLGFMTAMEVDNLYFYFVLYDETQDFVKLTQAEDMARLVYINKSDVIKEKGYMVKEKIASNNFDDVVPTEFESKGVVTLTDTDVDRKVHGKVIRLSSKNSDGNFTDSYYRTKYNLVNSSYNSSLLTGDELLEAQHVIFEIDILLKDYVRAGINGIGHVDLNTRTAFDLVTFLPDGTCRFLNAATYQYEKNVWYSYRFYINFADNVYTAWKDGVLIHEKISLGAIKYNYALSFGVRFIGTPSIGTFIDIDYYSFNYVEYNPEAQYSNKYKEGVLIGSLYDENGRLISVDICSRSDLDKACETFFMVKFETLPNTKSYYMFWDNIQTMKPLDKKRFIK